MIEGLLFFILDLLVFLEIPLWNDNNSIQASKLAIRRCVQNHYKPLKLLADKFFFIDELFNDTHPKYIAAFSKSLNLTQFLLDSKLISVAGGNEKNETLILAQMPHIVTSLQFMDFKIKHDLVSGNYLIYGLLEKEKCVDDYYVANANPHMDVFKLDDNFDSSDYLSFQKHLPPATQIALSDDIVYKFGQIIHSLNNTKSTTSTKGHIMKTR